MVASGRDEVKLSQLAEEVGCLSVVADLGEPQAAARLYMEAREKLEGAPDFLVNSAGYNSRKAKFVDVTDEELDQQWMVNLRAPAILCREALRDMSARFPGWRIESIGTDISPSVLEKARAGLRFQVAGGQVVFFRNFEGGLSYSLSRGSGNWQDPISAGDWPGAGEHLLTIDVTDPKKGAIAFRVDGELRGEASLGGMGKKGDVTLAIYGQADAVGDRVEFSVREARVYVLRAPREARRAGF